MANGRNQPRRPRGDVTGRQMDKARADAQKELAQRQDEIAMINKIESAATDDAVYDPETGNVVQESEESKRLVAREIERLEPDHVEDLTEDPVIKARLEENVGKAAAAVDGAEIVHDFNRKVVVVPNEDLDRMTVGAGTYYSMKQGRKHVVPLHVAKHMEEKDLLWGPIVNYS